MNRIDREYIDNDVVNGETYWYKLEDVSIYGVGTFHGPVSATPKAGYSTAANAEAATYGSSSLTGSGIFNSLALLLVPAGAVIVLGIWRRKR